MKCELLLKFYNILNKQVFEILLNQILLISICDINISQKIYITKTVLNLWFYLMRLNKILLFIYKFYYFSSLINI